jgi:hypothetical protein
VTTAIRNRLGNFAMLAAIALFWCNDALMNRARRACSAGMVLVLLMGEWRELPLELRPLVLARASEGALGVLLQIETVGFSVRAFSV